MNESTKQIVIAVVASAAAAATAALVTHYLTKQATINSVAKGETPLPQGSTPTTSITKDKPDVPKGQPSDQSSSVPPTVEQAANLVQSFMGPSWSNASP
jgi:hypothetical protein